MDPAWAETECGKQEKELADADPNEFCNVYVQQQLETYIYQSGEQFTQDTVVIPDGMRNAGEVRPAVVEPDHWAESVDYFGSHATYTDHLMRQKVAALNPQSWAAIELNYYFWPWQQNGNAVASCAEYVYEKWYDYSRYQDDAAALKSNYRAIFDRARRWPDGLQWGPIKSKDGTPQREVAWPTAMVPKNSYFMFQPTSWDVYPFDPTTIPSAYGTEYWNVDWWFFGMVDGAMAMAGKTDAEMYDMDVKQEKFRKLLAKRAKLIAALEKEHSGTYGFMTVSPHASLSPVTDEFLPMHDFYSVKEPPDIEVFTGGGTPIDVPVIFTGGYSGNMGELYGVDYTLSHMLTEARDKGCLDLYNPSVCDSSPQQFVRYLGKQFVSEMESDYNRCVRTTGDDFSPSSLIRTAITHGIPGASMEDFTGSSTDVTHFFDLYESYVASRDFTPAPGSVTDGATGWWKSDSSSAGSPDLIQGSYDWALGFGVRKTSASPTPDCSAELSALAQFHADVTVASYPYRVVDFLTTLDTQADNKLHAHSHLKIVGKDIYTRDSDAGLTFDVLDINDTAKETYRGNTMIGPIPVTYELGIVGEGSLTLGFGATFGRVCAGGPATVNLVVDGHMTAHASGGLLASAGVGVTGLSVGISGTLNLVDVTFSPKATLQIHNELPGDLSSLVADLNLDLPRRFSTLSGKVDAYAELPWKTYTKTLAKWDGFPIEVNDSPARPIHIPLNKVWSKL